MNVLPILFDSESFVAIDKPAGMLSVPGRTGDKDPRPVAGLILQAQLETRVWPIHRLDREVSGLILFAKSAEAHRAAGQLFESREVRKVYTALSGGELEGPFPTEPVHWESKLVRGKKRTFEAPHGKPSATVARCLGPAEWAGQPCLKWELQPLTGRSHQLRYEMAKHGFPILGDGLYGSKRTFEPEAIALRAVALEFGRHTERGRLGELPRRLEAPEVF